MARSNGTSKRGLAPFTYKPSQADANATNTIDLNTVIVPQDESTRGYPVNPPPPTSTPPPQQTIIPPRNITIGPVELFTASVSGNGSSATYTSTNYHGFITGDTVNISGFSNSGFNGLFTINSYTGKTFTTPNSFVGTASAGTVKNAKNNCGIIIVGNDGSTTVDSYVTFDEVLNAVDYKVEVIRVD